MQRHPLEEALATATYTLNGTTEDLVETHTERSAYLADHSITDPPFNGIQRNPACKRSTEYLTSTMRYHGKHPQIHAPESSFFGESPQR